MNRPNDLENEVNGKKIKKVIIPPRDRTVRTHDQKHNAGTAIPLGYVASRWEQCKAAI